MLKLNIRKHIYTFRHTYLTFNNIIIFVAFFIAASWVWGSLQVMQRNFALQKQVDQKSRQLELTQLQRDSLELQKRFFQTNEYKELAARETLGLVMPGEKLIILPANSQSVIDADKAASTTVASLPQDTSSNIEQWLNFLFGGYSKSIKS
jgi:cell division protein FtsB